MKISFEISSGRKSKKRSYDAADKGRRGKSFRNAKSTGVNQETRGALETLRNRSRQMVRNNGWSKRAVEAITRHTIGEGIQPAPAGKLSDTQDVKRIWRDWAATTACDWYGKSNFYGLQELAMRSIVESGEVLIYKRWVVPEDDCEIPMKLQILEADHLDHTRNGPNDMGFVRMGVQFDKERRTIGYWIFDHHPGENDYFGEGIYESHFVPKSDIIHAFEILRPGQIRGIPFGVASFMKSQDFSDYEDAQLFKQKVAACYSVFVLGAENMSPDEDRARLENLEPGIVEYLTSGESVEFADPPSVGDYDPYSARILQGIASAYGITYEMLTMDYSKVNFTSGRMAKIDVTTNFRSWQYNLFVPQVCDTVWRWFVGACMIVGKLNDRKKADWTAPRVQQLDPVKETDAQVKKIQAGLATVSETLRENGREPEEFFEEYKQDVERCKALGINISSLLLQAEMPQGEIIPTFEETGGGR